jgi:hypothetical protein
LLLAPLVQAPRADAEAAAPPDCTPCTTSRTRRSPASFQLANWASVSLGAMVRCVLRLVGPIFFWLVIVKVLPHRKQRHSKNNKQRRKNV